MTTTMIPSCDNPARIINVVCIGNASVGKSTLIGHLLFQCDQVEKECFESAKNEATKRDSIFAFTMYNLKAERERDITIDFSLRKLDTVRYCINLYDTPGTKDFIKNMIKVTSQADVAIVVVSPSDPEFETKVPKTAQIFERILIAHSLGVKQIIVVINKMDLIKWDVACYEEVKSTVSACLSEIGGYDEETVHFIPTSALEGENLTKRSDKFQSYKGLTLLEALNDIKEPIRKVHTPLRIPIQEVYKIKDVDGVIILGTVDSGVLTTGMKIRIPPNIVTSVNLIEMHHKPISHAFPGYNAAFQITTPNQEDIRSGMLVGDELNYPPRLVSSFIAKIVIFNHPGLIMRGYCPVLDAHATHACKFETLIAKINPQTDEVIEQSPRSLKNGDTAIVQFLPLKNFCIESFLMFDRLSRFVIRDMRRTVAFGIVNDVSYKD